MDERPLPDLALEVLTDRRALERFRRAYRGADDPIAALRSVLRSSPETTRLEELRLSMFRPTADEGTAATYRAARDRAARLEADIRAALPDGRPSARPNRIGAPPGLPRPPAAAVVAVLVLACIAAAAVIAKTSGDRGGAPPIERPVALARGAIAAPSLLAWDPDRARAAAERAAVAEAVGGAGDLRAAVARFATSAARAGRPLATVSGSGVQRTTVSLDPFGGAVTATSEIGVLVACERGRFRMTLGTVTQGRSQIIVAPLAVGGGACGGGVQVIRYRPIRGLLPTTATLEVPAGTRGALQVTLSE